MFGIDIALNQYMVNSTTTGPIILYVNDDASGANNGTNWTDAFTSLQSALTASAGMVNEIWVAAGNYRPTTDTDRTKTFQLKSGLRIFGGFAGTEILRHRRVKAGE